MEMLIKHYKVILKGMCGNKTLKAVERSTAAAYGLNKIIQNCDPPQDFSHFGADTRTTRSHDMLSMLKTVLCVYFSSKTKDTMSPCSFVFFYLPDT